MNWINIERLNYSRKQIAFESKTTTSHQENSSSSSSDPEQSTNHFIRYKLISATSRIRLLCMLLLLLLSLLLMERDIYSVIIGQKHWEGLSE